MIIDIKKYYTIKFVHAGIYQYAEFYEKENGELSNPTLHVSYSKLSEIPDVSGMKTIDEVLEAIKKIYPRAEIFLINGKPLFFEKILNVNNHVKTMKTEYENFIEEKSKNFFNLYIKPIMKKRRWKIGVSGFGRLIFIKKDKNGEWDNVNDVDKEFELEYLCLEALISLGIVDKYDYKNDILEKRISVSHIFLNTIYDYITESELFIKL